jgi:hypothetical protein
MDFATSVTPAQRARRASSIPLQAYDADCEIYATGEREIRSVYDMGVEIPLETDYPGLDALKMAHIEPGYSAACPGYVRLGSRPVGTVTADF